MTATASKLTAFEPTKGEIMQIKRLITEAGRLQDEMAPGLKRLEELKREIKGFQTKMAGAPENTTVLVSGEYVAELGAEKEQRELTPEVNSKVFHLVGVAQFMELVKLQIPATKKAISEATLDVIAPPSFQGKGRTFKLVKKQ